MGRRGPQWIQISEKLGAECGMRTRAFPFYLFPPGNSPFSIGKKKNASKIQQSFIDGIYINSCKV